MTKRNKPIFKSLRKDKQPLEEKEKIESEVHDSEKVNLLATDSKETPTINAELLRSHIIGAGWN